jgi:conjugal transfer pilus assembly protein TraU
LNSGVGIELLPPADLEGFQGRHYIFSGAETLVAPAIGPGIAPYYPPQLCGCVCLLGVCIPGLPIGYFEPVRLVEVVHDQLCFPTFGTSLGAGGFSFIGAGSESTQIENLEQNHLYMHVHYMAFPLWYIIGLVVDSLCVNPSGAFDEIDILFMSEIDPTWNDDVLAMILSPEALLLANPISLMACAADSLAASVDFPIDALFWCAGSAGYLYPMDGNVSGAGNDIQRSALLTYRMLAKLARTGAELYTAGNAVLICSDYPTGIIVKSQYKFQLLYPIPSFRSPLGSCCHPLGRTSIMWGGGKEIPAVGEDFVWLLWRLQRCCML